MSEKSQRVELSEIDNQRTLGWIDFHPEDFCHRCGNRNLESWSAPSWWWNRVWADSAEDEDDYQGIVCPQCFNELAAQSGLSPTWRIEPDMATVVPCHSCDVRVHDATCHRCTGGKSCPSRCECICHCPEFRYVRRPPPFDSVPPEADLIEARELLVAVLPDIQWLANKNRSIGVERKYLIAKVEAWIVKHPQSK